MPVVLSPGGDLVLAAAIRPQQTCHGIGYPGDERRSRLSKERAEGENFSTSLPGFMATSKRSYSSASSAGNWQNGSPYADIAALSGTLQEFHSSPRSWQSFPSTKGRITPSVSRGRRLDVVSSSISNTGLTHSYTHLYKGMHDVWMILAMK